MTTTPGGGIDVWVFLVIGLLGGAHCLGMCGPLVTVYADRLGTDTRRLRWIDVRQQLLFNLGRTASYTALGAAFGLVGATAYDTAGLIEAADTVRAVAGLAAGIVIAGVGTTYLVRGMPHGTGLLPELDAFSRVTATLTDRVDRWVHGPGIAALGALHGLLPCPILYPAFLYALVLGDPFRGGLLLGALGVGTIPSLLVYGTIIGSVDAGIRRRLHHALGAAFLALSLIPLAMGLRWFGIDLPVPMPPFYQPLG